MSRKKLPIDRYPYIDNDFKGYAKEFEELNERVTETENDIDELEEHVSNIDETISGIENNIDEIDNKTGLVLNSPNGTQYVLTVGDDGTLSTTPLTELQGGE